MSRIPNLILFFSKKKDQFKSSSCKRTNFILYEGDIVTTLRTTKNNVKYKRKAGLWHDSLKFAHVD